MYEKDGEKYFVVDATCTSGTRARRTGSRGQEQYAKGWIECFHAYQGLGPPETHWSIEHFQKYSVEDFEKDVFTDGYVDKAVFQSTYLREWYTNGFNDIEQNAALLERFPGKLIVNGRFDPREGEAGLAQLEADARAATTCRASSSTRPSGVRARAAGRSTTRRREPFLEKCQELGIKNIHVHKGPTIWPLDKDALRRHGRRPSRRRASPS